MYEELNVLSMKDSSLFTSLSYILLVVMVLVLYRSKYLTVIMMVVMGFSALLLLELYGMAHQSFNMVTIVLPTLIIILSTADVSHVFNHFCIHKENIKKNKEEGLIKLYSEIITPCFFTSATTCLGFASIYFSKIAILRTFGVFAAISAIMEFFIVMIVTAFLLGKIDLNKNISINRPFSKLSSQAVNFAIKNNKKLILFFIILIGFSIHFALTINVDTYSMGFLKDSNEVKINSKFVENNYGFYLPLEVRLITDKNNGIKDPEFLNRLDKAQIEIEKLDFASKCASITDVIKRLNQLWTDGKDSSYKICENEIQVHQLLDFYSSDPDNDLKYMTDNNYKEARLTIRIPMVSAMNMEKIKVFIQKILISSFENYKVEIEFGGYVPLYIKLLEYITWSQIVSFTTAITVIFILVGLLFMRFSALLIGLITNISPIILIMGVMGANGIRLDIATVTIAAITLGIAVDDTIHILFHYYHFRQKGIPPEPSIRKCIEIEGSPVISTSIILCSGFIILGLASIKSVVFFGILIAITMIFALLCDILILPSLISLLNKSEK